MLDRSEQREEAVVLYPGDNFGGRYDFVYNNDDTDK